MKSAVAEVVHKDKPGIIYELLGGSPSDLLLPRNFLIVEGKSDQIFINAIIDRFYSDKPPVQIILSEGNFEKQRDSMNAINSVYSPLAQNPIYRDRLIILCDHPHPSKQPDFDGFKGAYPALIANNQLHILPVPSLEEYYAGQFKKTSTEVTALGRELGFKRELARHVEKNITQEEFEVEMSAIGFALSECWTNAYS
jgi:hypothetical protein